MKTDCKNWKSSLCLITAVAITFTTFPIKTMAANTNVNIVAENDNVDAQKIIDTEQDSVRMQAGAAILLDADMSMGNDELLTLVRATNIPSSESKETSKLVMANVSQYVNIRQEATSESEKVGVLYKDCGGELIEKKAEWTKIKSGDVTGWVNNEFLHFGDEAENLAKEVGILTAHSTTETLRVRREASLDAEVIGLLANGEAVEAIEEAGDWVKVSYEGTTGFVSAEFVSVKFDIDTAESMEEIKEREAQEQKAKLNEQKAAVLATASELDILAALIQCEAGGEPYEGQLAVGAVVMNRVRCGGYPNSITEVIYASGQFAPAAGGKMQSLILNGNIKASCRQAAQEVINGTCNVGNALHFRRAGNRDGLVIGNHVFW